MSQDATEQVLVVPTSLLHELGYFQGFSAEVGKYLDELLHPRHASYRPRPVMEQDPSFKQLIPYVIFRYQDPAGETFLFHYLRGKGQGEARLHSKRSVGIGGHICSEDHAAAKGNAPYYEGMQRELQEEVLIDTPYTEKLVGLLNDDHTEVGRVHLGVVHLFDVQEPRVQPREQDLLEAEFRPLSLLMGQLAEFESWSRICLEALFGKP